MRFRLIANFFSKVSVLLAKRTLIPLVVWARSASCCLPLYNQGMLWRISLLAVWRKQVHNSMSIMDRCRIVSILILDRAGDLMQDLKTGHLIQASPRAQFYGQIIGSTLSIFVTVTAYTLYNKAYTIPGPSFPAPTAYIWLGLARLLRRSLLRRSI